MEKNCSTCDHGGRCLERSRRYPCRDYKKKTPYSGNCNRGQITTYPYYTGKEDKKQDDAEKI